MAYETFKAELTGVLWTAFVDNQGVLHGLLKGSAGADEANAMIGSLWLILARMETALFLQRVESKANIADGPTRHCLDFVSQLDATYRAPQLPSWAFDVW